jgi:hypothetical protein
MHINKNYNNAKSLEYKPSTEVQIQNARLPVSINIELLGQPGRQTE